MAFELERRGLAVIRQQAIPVVWETVRLPEGFRADLIVGGLVLVELKSIEVLAPVHKKVVLTDLRLTGKRLGLLIDFSVNLIKHGICRVANHLHV